MKAPEGRASRPETTVWRSFRSDSERLYFTTTRWVLPRRSLRFEPGALVVCGGEEQLFRWDDYRSPTWRNDQGWSAHLNPGVRTRPSLTLASSDELGQARVVPISAWSGSSGLEELAALIEFLGRVPTARGALARPGVPSKLVTALASDTRRAARTPVDSVTVNGYVVPLADALAKHSWFIRGRLVEGSPEPPVDRIVQELLAGAPQWAHLEAGRDRIASRIERIVHRGRWPFGVLVGPTGSP